MIVSHPKAKEQQKQIKIQATNVSELVLTEASAVLLSFPMAQPAAGQQLPRLTASHFICLKDTNAEGPLTHDSFHKIWSSAPSSTAPVTTRLEVSQSEVECSVCVCVC